MSMRTAILAAALAAMAATAQAGTYTFTQGGFSGGGRIDGSFAGADADGNGIIDFSANEVTAFFVGFSGDTAVGSFSLGLDDLAGLVYDLHGGSFIGDGGAIGSGEGIAAFTSQFAYLTGVGLVGLKPSTGNGGDVLAGDWQSPAASSGTMALVAVSPVPEPENAALWLGGLAMLGFGRRRR